MKRQNKQKHGFTLVELILVVLILAIAAMVAVPAFSSASDLQVRATANRIAGDLDFVRGLAITRQQNYAIVFDPVGESYDIRAAGGDESTVITNPLDGRDFAVDLTADSSVGGVNIVSTVFDGTADNAITFDYLGTPYAGNDAGLGSRLAAEGIITLRSRDGSFELQIKVEPVTGTVTID